MKIYDQIARKSIPKKSMISSCIHMLSAKNYTFFFIQTGRSENLWRKVKEFDSFLHATLTRLWMACKLQEALFTSTHHFYFTTYIFSIFIFIELILLFLRIQNSRTLCDTPLEGEERNRGLLYWIIYWIESSLHESILNQILNWINLGIGHPRQRHAECVYLQFFFFL